MQSHRLMLAIGLPEGGEWLVIALALMLLFGKRLPEVMRSLGSGVREFKRGMRGDGDHHGGDAGAVAAARPDPMGEPGGERPR